MMTKEQQQAVTTVLRRFADIDNSSTTWTDVDEQMSLLEWLSDHQITVEAEVKLLAQRKGNPRCKADHPTSQCFVPTVLEAVDAILQLYKETGNLHLKNRYILTYYTVLSYNGTIIS